MLTSEHNCLPVQEWQRLAEQHRAEVKQWTDPYRKRLASHRKHPVYDFLFTYYPFSLGKMEQWHPGYSVALECQNKPPERYTSKYYRHQDGRVFLDPTTLSEKQIHRLTWIHNLLSLTQNRTPNFSCFGMHEWAMVYEGSDIRHRQSAPLRLSQSEINTIVETRPITCSHFDAYRFFAPAALEFNKLRPTLDHRPDFEQCGCLHTNMDLYKWSSKCMPWIGSDLLWACFQLALKARELDMRASPYDLSEFGYEPIKIETPQGREQYEAQQRHISNLSRPLRQQLIDQLAILLNSVAQ